MTVPNGRDRRRGVDEGTVNHRSTDVRLEALVQAWPYRASKKPSPRLPRVASLFGKRKLEALAEEVSTEEIQDKLEIVRRWHKDYRHGSLKADKETSREQAYNSDFFITILGYQDKPATPFTFEPKATTEKKQLPDAVLSYTDTSADIANIAAVVELKGAATALDRPQRREGNMSPVQQGFKYKTQYRTCPFVVVSNFYEFRLYNDNQLDFETWTLDDLVNPAGDYYAFKTWYGLLRRENFVADRGQSKTEQLLSHFRIEQEAIGKEFYAKYKDARLELLRDIYRHNPDLRTKFDLAIQLGQKIVDRVVFSCFAEDRGLLPENVLASVQRDADTSAYSSLWMMLKSLFSAIDSGSDNLGIPIGYNGGLFAHDPVLDGLKVSDEALKGVLNLSNYNFEEDLSVNILGHIFEQSITDLEEIRSKVQSKVETDAPPADALDELVKREKVTGKRKSEGVYYTPDYIVRYIVDSTLGAFLKDKEQALIEKHELSKRRKDETYRESEVRAYKQYQYVLQNVKVIDPACGSGAFLVYALDYLLRENERVVAILEEEDFFTVDYWIDSILRQNLFGVDINDESVEITKLSLWLKTARAGKKLTSLDDNIKCGNSLISDKAVDQVKGFSYEVAFPDVFKTGGFDIVFGNPPYVSAMELSRSMPVVERKYLKKKYETSTGSVDLYIYFFEKGMKLLKDGGRLGFISPNRYLSASYGKGLRTWLVDNYRFSTLLDYSDKTVFEDASTYPVITILDKLPPGDGYTLVAGNIDEETKRPVLKEFDSSRLSILNEHILGFLLNDKIDITEKVFQQGVGLSKAGTINATSTASEADDYSPLIAEDEETGPKLINTGTIDPYASTWGYDQLTNQGKTFVRPRLKVSSPIVSANRRSLYSSPKIVISKIGKTCEAFYDAKGEYASINTNCVHSFTSDFKPEYVLCWLNSKLYNFAFECLFDGLRMNGGYLLYSAPTLKNTPIKQVSAEEQGRFVELASTLAELHASLIKTDARFKKFAKQETGVAVWPRKFNKWWDVDYFDMLKGLKSKMSVQKKDELQEYFEGYQAKMQEIVDGVDAAQAEVDALFYSMFGLSSEEIDFVEASFTV